MTVATEQERGLPKGWSFVRLADVGSFLSGSGFPLVYQGNTSGDYPFFKVSDFSNPGNERTLNRANHYIDESTRKKMGARLFPEGGIAFAKIGAAIFLERKRFIDQASCLDNNMAAFVISAPGISRDLILAHLQSFPLGSLVSSTALPAISSTDLKSIVFPLPDNHKEQEAIAEALSDAAALIEGLERLIAKKRLIKQGAMQNLLTAKRRLPGFSGEWKHAEFGSIIRNVLPKSSRPASFATTSGDYPFFLSGAKEAKATTADYNSPGAIIFSCGGSFRARHASGDFSMSSDCLGAETEGDARFFASWMEMNADSLDAETFYGSGLRHLDKERLRSVIVPCPSDAEQSAIADLLHDMETEIVALEGRLEKARSIKSGMMQALLTGRIRLDPKSSSEQFLEAAE